MNTPYDEPLSKFIYIEKIFPKFKQRTDRRVQKYSVVSTPQQTGIFIMLTTHPTYDHFDRLTSIRQLSNTPPHPRDLLIDVLREKHIPLYSLVDEKTQNEIRKTIKEKISKKIHEYQGCVRAIVRVWYYMHSDIVKKELDKQNAFSDTTYPAASNIPLLFDASRSQDRAKRLIFAAKHGRTQEALALIHVMSAEELALGSNGEIALSWAAYHGFREIALALISKMLSEHLSIQELDGKTPFYWAVYQGHEEIAWAMIPRMSPKQLSIAEEHGETSLSMAIKKTRTAIALKLLHIIYAKENFPKYSQLLQTITNNQVKKSLELLTKLNQWVSYPEYRYLFHAKMLDSWLTKPKNLITTTQISQQEYPERAQILKNKTIQLFQDLEIGTKGQNIHPKSLGRYTKQEILNALKHILKNICEKTAWLGTPPSHASEKIHLFYSEMLSNFEVIVKELQAKKDPEQIFSCLFSIAQPDLEERCAAAHQAEILQTKTLLIDVEKMTFSVRLESILNKILTFKVKKIVDDKFSSDCHEYAQMFYFVGLSSVPDPLSTLKVVRAFSLIKSTWDTDVLCEWMTSMQQIPQDLIFDWFKDQTPHTLRPNKRLLRQARMFETELMVHVRRKLNAMQIDPKHKKPFLRWMTSPRGGALSYSPQALSPIWLQKITQKKIPIQGVLDPSQMRTLLEPIKPKRQGKAIEYIQEMNKFNVLIDTLVKRNACKQELQKLFSLKRLPSDQFEKFMEIYHSVSKKIKAWCEANGVPHLSSHSPLPSACMQEEVRIQYASSHFEENGRLNPKGVKKIIEKIGVAELSEKHLRKIG